tara:strand:- start:13 stop:321 length:309 start_codon:yes stop_codon:yes gene_type:complete
MRVASATDEPPNFITTLYASSALPGWVGAAVGASFGADGATEAEARTAEGTEVQRRERRGAIRAGNTGAAARETFWLLTKGAPCRATRQAIGGMWADISDPT